ncbi:MAG: hypothetical protein ACK6DQ_04500, partial [Planctomycetota bacterium]
MRSHSNEHDSSVANQLKGPKGHHAELQTPVLSPVGEDFEASVSMRSGSKSQPRIPEVYHIQW